MSAWIECNDIFGDSEPAKWGPYMDIWSRFAILMTTPLHMIEEGIGVREGL